MDRGTHRLVNYLIYNESATDLDIQLLGIHDVNSTIREAKKYGYQIKRKYKNRLWNRNKVYYMHKKK